jgi:hypothetical protein
MAAKKKKTGKASSAAPAEQDNQDAGRRCRRGSGRCRRCCCGGFGRTLLFALVASAVALALSESLRSKVLDLVFGAEEEFDYSSTTFPVQEAPSSADDPGD